MTERKGCPPNCPDRCPEPNCHTTCQRYAEYLEQLARSKEPEGEKKSPQIQRQPSVYQYDRLREKEAPKQKAQKIDR